MRMSKLLAGAGWDVLRDVAAGNAAGQSSITRLARARRRPIVTIGRVEWPGPRIAVARCHAALDFGLAGTDHHLRMCRC
jgi:hypothetical protein